jgi:hypothetical protein
LEIREMGRTEVRRYKKRHFRGDDRAKQNSHWKI